MDLISGVYLDSLNVQSGYPPPLQQTAVEYPASNRSAIPGSTDARMRIVAQLPSWQLFCI